MNERTPARERAERRRFQRDRRIQRAVEARQKTGASAGRMWVNGREVGGTDTRYQHLATAFD